MSLALYSQLDVTFFHFLKYEGIPENELSRKGLLLAIIRNDCTADESLASRLSRTFCSRERVPAFAPTNHPLFGRTQFIWELGLFRA